MDFLHQIAQFLYAAGLLDPLIERELVTVLRCKLLRDVGIHLQIRALLLRLLFFGAMPR